MELETSIYNNLPSTTESGNVVIHKVYQRKGVEYAKSIGGAFTLRVKDMNNHFGNPYSHDRRLCDKDDLIPCATVKDAVIMYIHWVLRSFEPRAIWIRSVLDSKVLVGKPLVYYTELNEPSHANALDYLINNWDKVKI